MVALVGLHVLGHLLPEPYSEVSRDLAEAPDKQGGHVVLTVSE